jgi:D-tyrosyl-tRNA(Tyr) deacylase
VIQRVVRARVTVEADEVLRMDEGLLALIGVGRRDAKDSAEELARRIVNLRIFEDAEGRMNRSLLETGGTLGVVSQFTLLGDARKGRRPSWLEAASPEQAEPLVMAVADAARKAGLRVVTGRFRAHMDVALVNSGPVTILLDSRRLF